MLPDRDRFGGPESMLKNIFQKARLMAPCLLIFEDLDSVITDGVRSYFLNEGMSGRAPSHHNEQQQQN